METNPHVLLPFGPKTKGGHEVLFISPHSVYGAKAILVVGKNYYQRHSVRGKISVHDESSWDLLHADQPPYAPQPYTMWEDAREKDRLKIAAKHLLVAAKNLAAILSVEYSRKWDEYFTADYNGYIEAVSFAREALKEGRDA